MAIQNSVMYKMRIIIRMTADGKVAELQPPTFSSQFEDNNLGQVPACKHHAPLYQLFCGHLI